MPHPRSQLNPRSILIVRLSAIGDNVMATPLIRACRRAFPDAAIDWVVQAESHELVCHHPELREAILWPTKRFKQLARERRYLQLAREWLQAAQGIRQRHYDWVIDTQGLLKSGLIAWISGARYRIASGAREGCQLLVHDRVPKPNTGTDICAEYRDIATFLGLPDSPFEMELQLSTAARERASAALQLHGLARARFITILPFTTRPQKHWIEDHWVTLIDAWWKQMQVPCVLLGGPGDQEATQRLLGRLADPASVINLSGMHFLSVPDAAAFIAHTGLSIGVDTGMTHMSIAQKRPTLCLFGSSVPYTRTCVPNVTILFEPLACAPCRRHPTCNNRFDCMQMLTPERVLQAAAQLYAQGQPLA
jgi:heptosyltransferase I